MELRSDGDVRAAVSRDRLHFRQRGFGPVFFRKWSLSLFTSVVESAVAMTFPDAAAICALQSAKTVEWHDKPFAPSQDGFLGLVESNHHCNFELWHEEDKARRDDMGFEYVYRAKRAIDAWNQRRNNFIESMDRWLVEHVQPPLQGVPMSSETPGMMIDRLSILALKEFHMAEESVRESAPAAQREQCAAKLAVIRRQRGDLATALQALIDDCRAGRRGFSVYYQMKMYNDAALNPQLYGREG